MASPQQSPAPITAAQIASMDTVTRQQYVNSLPPDQQASMSSSLSSYQATQNRNYMRKAIVHEQSLLTSTGAATTVTYAVATSYQFTVPSANNGFLHKLIFIVSPQYTLATGTSAVYGLTPAGALGLISRVIVSLNNNQFIFRPYILKTVRQLKRYLGMSWPSRVPNSTQWPVNSFVDTYLKTADSTFISTGAQTPSLVFEVDLNFLNHEDVRGILPITAGDTAVQVTVETPTALWAANPDPRLTPLYTVSGSGHAVSAVGGTIQVACEYRDGMNYDSPMLLAPDLSGLPTTQILIDTGISPLTTSVVSQKPSVLDKIAFYIATICDGQQSSAYCAAGNIAILQAAKDAAGQNLFWKYGTGTNLSINEYYRYWRGRLGDDFDYGIVPFIAAPSAGNHNIDNQDGLQFLNTAPTGWPDYHAGLQVGTVSSSNFTPSVEFHTFYLNSAGLQFAS